MSRTILVTGPTLADSAVKLARARDARIVTMKPYGTPEEVAEVAAREDASAVIVRSGGRIGGPVYHENHEGSYRLNPDAYVGREAEAPWGDRRWHQSGVSYVNPSTWGLSEAPTRQMAERCWHLDFSWDALPRMVDLRRVVMPVARRGGPSPGMYVQRR